MKRNINRKSTIVTTAARFYHLRLAASATLAILIALACLPAAARDGDGNGNGEAEYEQTNLVADLPGVAQVTDTNLVNPWGVSFSATSPFWVSDNGTGVSTLYAVTNDPLGNPVVVTQSLVVSIPGDGTPTGQFFDGNGSFNGDIFIFVSEDGTISGWRPALNTAAETLVSGSTNNVYKGVALTEINQAPALLAANFRQATVDVYDTNMTLVHQFKDRFAPRGFAPFNVQSIDGIIFVTYAVQDSAKHDDVAGPGNGLIDLLDPRTGRFVRFATGRSAGGGLDDISSPWGVAVSPRDFGAASDELLVGNFGSGTIMRFDVFGRFRGLLENTNRDPLVIDGLWALNFGNGGAAGVPDTLYFTAGPNSESHGILGSLTPVNNRHDRDGDDDNNGRFDR